MRDKHPSQPRVADRFAAARTRLTSGLSRDSAMAEQARTLIAAGEPLMISAHACWRSIGRIALQSLPGIQPLENAPGEAREALRRSGRLVVLYPLAESRAQPLMAFVVHRRGQGPERQQRQFRQKLRAGRRVCSDSPLAWLGRSWSLRGWR